MSTNPFDDEDGTFHALVNDEGQYSLWPTFADVPPGWTVAHGPADRQACLEHVEQLDRLRPRSLASARRALSARTADPTAGR